MNSVIALVLTRNRKDLLKRCLISILNQTQKPDKIIVINNAGTDGTSEMIKELSGAIEEVYLHENIGGAAGFRYGIELCARENFDFIWIMDDDGYPKEDALEKLIKSTNNIKLNKIGVLNSIVIDPTTNEFTFGVWESYQSGKLKKLYRNFTELSSYKMSKNYFYGWANLFNGTLLKSNVVKELGLPDDRYFFRGDEVDYLHKIKKSFEVVTVLNSVHFHPIPKHTFDQGWRLYYATRNETINNLKHLRRDLPYLIKQYLKLLLFCMKFIFSNLFGQKNNKNNELAYIWGLFDGLRFNMNKKSQEIMEKFPID